jgi:predicted MFS family arabinose efflux permease
MQTAQRCRVGVVRVVRTPALRRLEFGFAGFSVMENASWLAIMIYAFDRGGAKATALVMMVQLVPAVMVSPFAAAAGDRFSPHLALRIGYLAQAAALAATTAALMADVEVLAYIGAAVTATSFTFTRPIVGTLLPHHAPDHDDLVAANVVTGCLENLGVFLGPALAGLVITQTSVASLFGAGALTMVVCALTAPSKSTELTERPLVPSVAATDVVDGIFAGFRTIGQSADIRVLVGLLTCAGILAGIGDLLAVTFADVRLDGNDATAGVLGASLGLGGIVGSLAVSGLRQGRSASAFLAASAVLAGTGLAVLAAVDQLVVSVALFMAVGCGEAILRVTSNVTIQQCAPRAVRARVFGVVESLQLGGLAVGALLTALAIDTLGLSPGLISIGVGFGLATAAGVLRLKSVRSGSTDAANVHDRHDARLDAEAFSPPA